MPKTLHLTHFEQEVTDTINVATIAKERITFFMFLTF
jgi:hypothetical protein